MKKLLDNMDRVNARAREITKELEDMGYVTHHTAWAGGYLTRRPESVTIHRHLTRQFNGYVIEVPSFASSRYHVRIYYAKKD